MSQYVSRQGAIKLSLLTMVVTLGVAVPTAVWASHHFNDVATNHPFHKEISAVADAGIAAGFNDGGYHPAANVTRQAMAAFLERGLGRVAVNTDFSVDPFVTAIPIPPVTTTELETILIDAGAVGGSASGFVYLVGTAQFTSSAPNECPCTVEIGIRNLDTSDTSLARFDIPGVASEVQGGTKSHASGTAQAVFPVQGDGTGRFRLTVILYDGSMSITGRGQLGAVYVPFGPDGDDSLMYCGEEETEPNNTIGQAQTFSAPTVIGCIDPSGDVDLFQLIVSSGQQITASTNGLNGPGTCDLDTIITVRDSGGGVVWSDDDNGDGLCSSLSTGVLTPGTYYVEVVGYGSTTGTYLLTAVAET